MEPADTIAVYGAAWNEPDDAARTALLERAWSDDGVYRDPLGLAEGRAALVAHIGGFHTMMPGHRIEQASGVDVHGVWFRFAWRMRDGQSVVTEGVDFGQLAADGRIERITGFFGPLPELDG